MKRSEKAKAGPKFRVGQVVAVRDYHWQQWEYRILVSAKEGGVWKRHMRPLTARESGQRQRKGSK